MIKIGDRIQIQSVSDVVRDYAKKLGKMNWISIKDVNAMKEYCKLSENKKYKVVDYCRSCKYVFIAIGKNRLLIKQEFVKC